jgi:hypothetical protein
MSKNYFFKRFIAVGAFMTLAFAGSAQTTEICQWAWDPLFAANYANVDANTHEGWCLFTWETVPNGNVEITMSPHPDNVANEVTWKYAQFRGDDGMNIAGFSLSGGLTFGTYFNKTLSADKTKVILSPKQAIAAGTKILFSGAVYYKTNETALAGNGNDLYPNINFTGTTQTQSGFTYTCPAPGGYTYGTDCNGTVTVNSLNPPANVSVDAAGILTFDAVDGATSYSAYVYSGNVVFYTFNNVTPDGSLLDVTVPGAYTVKVQAFGDAVPSISDAANWTLTGEPVMPENNTSQYCTTYQNPAANCDFTFSWVTLPDGKMTVTLNGINGNNPKWRNGNNSMLPANFRVGSTTLYNGVRNGNDLFTVAFTNNVLTISLKAGVVIPVGTEINYTGSIQYTTEGASPGNKTYSMNWTYTYGTNCDNVVLTPLATPTNVAVDAAKVISFTGVENADNYTAFVFASSTQVYMQTNVVSGTSVLNFPLPGTYNVRVLANPSGANMGVYSPSAMSDPYVWTVNYQVPPTIPESVICGYELNPTAGNSVADDRDASMWSWYTDENGYIVISIDSAKYRQITLQAGDGGNPPAGTVINTEVAFRGADAMALTSFTVEGISGNLILETVSSPDGQSELKLKPKAGITLLPGLEIRYSGQVNHRVIPLNSPGNLDDLWPNNINFSNLTYIYGSVCGTGRTTLDAPINLVVDGDILTFDPVDNATSYTVCIYNSQNALVETQENFVSGGAILYPNPGIFTLKVKAVGNGSQYITSNESAGVEWTNIAALQTPVIQEINYLMQLYYVTVPSAISYTVTVYDAANPDVALLTLPNYVNGTVVPMEANLLPYGGYIVKIQAIGDNNLIIDSEVSSPYFWTYAGIGPMPSAICRWAYPETNFATATNRCRFTWTTVKDEYGYNEKVIIKIISAIEGETAGQTKFRGEGVEPGRLEGWTLNGELNTGKRFFEGSLQNNSTEFVLQFNDIINDGAVITTGDGANRTIEWTTSLANPYAQIEFPQFIVGSTAQCPDPSQLPAPTNVQMNGNIVSFTYVPHALSYRVYVYAGTIPMYEQQVSPTGTVINFTTSGTYNVRVRAIGDDVLFLNSDQSDPAVQWVITGEPPVINDSQFCHKYWNVDSPEDLTDDMFLTWETQPDGSIFVTVEEIGGNNTHFRSTGVQVEAFTLGNSTVANGAQFLTAQVSATNNKLCIISPKAGVTIPQGMILKYGGYMLYANNTTGNGYHTLNANYQYGSNCENIQFTPLNPPSNVRVETYEQMNMLLWDESDFAASYGAYIYMNGVLINSINPVLQGEPLNMQISGEFEIRMIAYPDPANQQNLVQSTESEPYIWNVSFNIPNTVAASVCRYLFDPQEAGGGGVPFEDVDKTYWTFYTDAEGQIVVEIAGQSIENGDTYDNDATTAFRANGLVAANFIVGGVPGSMALDKVTVSNPRQQVFKAKQGITLVPGITKIRYSGQCQYKIYDAANMPYQGLTLQNMFPTAVFPEFIYYGNCYGPSTFLAVPTGLSVVVDTLYFNEVEHATSYTVYIYDEYGELVGTQENYVSGTALTYPVQGHYTLKVRTVGNNQEWLSSLDKSESVEWIHRIKLDIPADIEVEYPTTLIFGAVENAVSYTVTVYAANDLDNPAATLTDFESGTSMGDFAYGSYIVKIQAIGDNDVILDSDISDGYAWEYLEQIDLTTPSIINIDGDKQLTYNEVANAVSYTIYIYAADDLENPVLVLTEFGNGDVIPTEDLAYGSYIVKIQAIGNENNISDSELSEGYEWSLLSVIDLVGADAILIFPNPVSDELYIFNLQNRNYNIEITDISGKIVVNSKLSNRKSINVSDLPKGVYFLNIDNKSIKFIKE